MVRTDIDRSKPCPEQTLLLSLLWQLRDPLSMQATLRFALRWQVWPPRTRLRLIRLMMRWNRDLVLRGDA
jgi:hypothetical protein